MSELDRFLRESRSIKAVLGPKFRSVHCHFHCILLAKARPKSSPDLMGLKAESISCWKQLEVTLQEPWTEYRYCIFVLHCILGAFGQIPGIVNFICLAIKYFHISINILSIVIALAGRKFGLFEPCFSVLLG